MAPRGISKFKQHRELLQTFTVFTLGMFASVRYPIIFIITKKARKETKTALMDNLTATMSGGAVLSAP